MSDTRHAPHAGLLAALAANPDDDLARNALADWFEDCGDERAAWVRDNEVWEWMKPDASDPLPRLIAAVRSRRGSRWRTIGALGKIGAAGIAPLLEVVPEANDAFSDRIGDALSHIGSRAAPALPLLLQASQSDDLRVRVAAIRGLGGMGEGFPEVEQRLIGALIEPEPVCTFAVKALEGCSRVSPAALPALVKMAKNGDWQTWPSAVSAIGAIGPAAGDAIPRLVAWLLDQRWNATAHALAKIGMPSLAPVLSLAAKLEAHEESHRFWQTAQAMAALGAEAIPALRRALGSPEPAACRFAALMLWMMAREGKGSAETLTDVYRELLRHGDPQVRRSAAAALRELDHPVRGGGHKATKACQPELLAILNDPQTPGDLLVEVVDTLQPIPSDRRALRAALCRCLNCPDTQARSNAVWRLSRMDPPFAVTYCLRSCAEVEEFRDVRNDPLTDTLRGTGSDVHEGFAPIHDWICATRDWKVRLRPLLEAGTDPDSIGLLAGALKDKTAAIRLTALYVLWNLGTPEAASALIEALGDRQATCRRLAILALASIGRGVPGMRQTVEAARQDRVKAVRELTDRVLREWDARPA